MGKIILTIAAFAAGYAYATMTPQQRSNIVRRIASKVQHNLPNDYAAYDSHNIEE